MRRILLLLMSFSLALLALLALSYATAEGSASASSPMQSFPWEAHHSSSWFSSLSDLNLASSDVRPVATVAGLSLLMYATWGLRLGAVAGQAAGAAGSAAAAAAQSTAAVGQSTAAAGQSTAAAGQSTASTAQSPAGGSAGPASLDQALPWHQAAVQSVGAAGPPGLSLGESGSSGAGQVIWHIGSEADALKSLGRKLQAIPKYGDLIGFFFIVAPRVSSYIRLHPRVWWRMDLFWGDTLGDVLHWGVTLLAGLLGALTGRLLTLALGAGFTDLAIMVGDALLTLVCDQVFTHVPEVDVRLRTLGRNAVYATVAKRPSGS